MEVARLGSISAAADTLGYTQSAISRQVQALESETGAQLLERLPRGVRLTTAGKAVERHARVILREVTRIAEAVAEPEAATATLSIGAVPSAAAALVPAVARRLRSDHPEVRLRFVEGFTPDLFGRVARGELDLAVVTDYPPGLPATPGVVLHHLADDEVLVAMPADHRLAGPTRRVRLDRFADDDWVEDYRGSAARAAAEASRRRLSCSSPSASRVPSARAIRSSGTRVIWSAVGRPPRRRPSPAPAGGAWPRGARAAAAWRVDERRAASGSRSAGFGAATTSARKRAKASAAAIGTCAGAHARSQ